MKFICKSGILILCITPAMMAQSVRSQIGDGNKLYNDQKYADAEAEYRKSLEQDKQIMQGYFDLGDALYKQQRYDEAAQNYQDALTKTNDPKIGAQLHHNIGNAQVEKKEYQGAIDEYKRSLKLNPDDEETKYNLAYAEQMLKQQQQQKQQQKQDKNDKNQQKNQNDKQKQDQKQNQQQQQPKDQQDQQRQQQQPQEKQMSRSEAQRILDALKNDEKDVQRKLRRKAAVKSNVEKDW